MQAKLYFTNGEVVTLSTTVSKSLLDIVNNPTGQSLQYCTANEGNFTYAMWNVVKIEWLFGEG